MMKQNHPHSEFTQLFQSLTGSHPLTWQERLFDDYFVRNEFPEVIDLPTGLGKTMVMTIWLIAREYNKSLPRRLIYVVDRRTVVDQATDLAKKLVDGWRNAFKGEAPAVSTLRGQLADNREWSRDPSRPAIIIGTVDLIGSGLLFSGYRSSFRRRPVEAGLLGQDSLLVLDEAHLSKPFEKLLGAIVGFNKTCGSCLVPVKPMEVIRMSATSSSSTDLNVFGLKLDSDRSLRGEDANDEIIAERYGALKTLSIVEAEKPIETIAIEADHLAKQKPGSRIAIFVHTPKQVTDVRNALKKKNGGYATRIVQLTGTMRGLERDELVDIEKPLQEDEHDRRAMQRYLKPDNDPSQGECFLISTSAGEVGFDLNADHLIGDEAPLDSWVQRLGRVNRRGKGNARVVLVKKKEPSAKTDFDKACVATSNLLRDGMDVSPKGLVAFKRSLLPGQIDQASSPEPMIVPLTEILLDAWSMTSIVEPMPGRPEVGPWLRGIAEWEPPQTTIAWRAELDLDGFGDLDFGDIEEWFDAHFVLTHETLQVNTGDAANWLKERWVALSEARQKELAKRVAILNRAGVEIVSMGEMIKRVSSKVADADAFLRGAQLIVPESFGGISRGVGLLDPTEPTLKETTEEAAPDAQARIVGTRHGLSRIDVADIGPAHARQRVVEAIIDGEKQEPRAIGGGAEPKPKVSLRIELESDDDKVVRLVSHVARREKPEVGSEPQTLKYHVDRVCSIANDIVMAFEVASDHPIRRAVELSAAWHDHGKNRERWQRTIGGTATVGTDWVYQTQLDGDGRHQCLGKSGGEMKRDRCGYRHEFGSLREFTDAFQADKLLDNIGRPISQDVFDLAMHLIAAHHGRGRPHFPKGAFDPEADAKADEMHSGCVRRFAQLQRKYGWWHLAWLENLLRCADALASDYQAAEEYAAHPEGDLP